MRWLLFGILSALFAGLWGLFDKLSGFQNPFTSNFILYLVAAVSAFLIMLIFSKKIQFSKYGLIAGLAVGVGNLFLMYALVKNSLILIFPFISMGSVVFFLIMFFTEKPKYTVKQKILLSAGLILAFMGIFLVATGSVGITTFFKTFKFDWFYLLSGLMVLLGAAFWTFFTYKSASKEKITSSTYNFWNFFGSFIIAFIAVLIFNRNLFSEIFSLTGNGYLYPVLAGLSILAGCFFAFRSFRGTNTKTKLQETISGIIVNCELIPLFFFSYFILHEWVWEGFIGSIIVLIGILILNFAEKN